MVIAVTGDDEDNLVVCQVAKAQFNVPRTIARINNPKNEDDLPRLGIDTTVSATAAILAQIEQELPTHPLIPLLTSQGRRPRDRRGQGAERTPQSSASGRATCCCRSSR